MTTPTTEPEPSPVESFHDKVARLHELADVLPDQVRLWVQRHPRNLMIYCGWEPYWFHDEGFDQFIGHASSLWLAPRGSGKSTVAVFFAAWLGISDPDHWDEEIGELFPGAPRDIGPWNIRIALTSNSHPKACALLWQLKSILTSREIAKLFGPLAGGRWKDHEADTRLRESNLREATYTALGLGSKVTGGHYDFVLADDWVTLDNARTELQRSRIADFWGFTVKETIEPWGRAAVAGTRYHPKDWYGTIAGWAKKEAARWSVLRQPAIMHTADGQPYSYWPQAYTLDKFDEIREEIGSIAFATQYQNTVDLMLGDFFEAEWLEKHAAWGELPKSTRESARTGLGLDFAFKGGPEHNWSVFSVIHHAPPKRFHIERVLRGKWTKDGLVRRAEFLVKLYKPVSFTIEAANGSEFLIQDMRKSRKIPRRIVKAMPPRISKTARADKVRSLFEREYVWFDPPSKANQLQIAIDELLGFTGEKDGQDDCVDSIVWNLIGLTRGRGRVRRAGVHR